MYDIIQKELLLNLDIVTLSTSKKHWNTCDNVLWEDKFIHDDLPLIQKQFTTIEWIKEYNIIKESMINAYELIEVFRNEAKYSLMMITIGDILKLTQKDHLLC